MSKKEQTTLLIVGAAAVALYFLLKNSRASAPAAQPSASLTALPGLALVSTNPGASAGPPSGILAPATLSATPTPGVEVVQQSAPTSYGSMTPQQIAFLNANNGLA